MPKLFEPMLTVLEPTPDGFAEVELTVNGHPVATTVVAPGDDVTAFFSWWREQVLKRC